MRRHDEWTRESEATALARLIGRHRDGPAPIAIAYTRQSQSDFDKSGNAIGPSLPQQLDAVTRRPELQGLRFEHYEDADRSGKETSRRPGYLAMMERIRTAEDGTIGAVAFYDSDRLHRNDLEFFQFMTEMTERQILVFDSNGLISNADKLSWKIKAVVAQEEREKIARRVRDNLRYLKRQGTLLGILPQGYRRGDGGSVIEDPEAAEVVRTIFAAYATGGYSFQTLADHLNRQGIKPCRGPQKENHNRKRALIFTGDVLKDMLNNPSYIGKVQSEGQLIEGQHPALIDEETWAACVDVRANNRRRTSKTWTRHTYPLTLVLYCGRCGAPMHGEASVDRDGTTNRLYYACHARRRRATDPSVIRCKAPFVRAEVIEGAIREELRRIAPGSDVNNAYRAGLRSTLATKPRAQKVTETAIKRLEDQVARIARLYEFGEYDWEAFVVKRAEIREEQERLRAEASSQPEEGDIEWCETQILDLIAAWDAGDDGQRSRLLAGLFDRIEAERLPGGGLRLVAMPRAGWARFFGAVVLERETRLELATSSLEG